MVACFCDSVVAVGSVLSLSRATAAAVLSRCCGHEMLLLFLVGLVLPIAVADIGG